MYIRKNDEMSIGASKLDEIVYSFWQDKVLGVRVLLTGSSNYSALKEASFEKFGVGLQNNRYMEEYHWFEDKTSMHLKYNEGSKRGELWLSSKKLYETEIKRWKEEKAKEGAKKGF